MSRVKLARPDRPFLSSEHTKSYRWSYGTLLCARVQRLSTLQVCCNSSGQKQW